MRSKVCAALVVVATAIAGGSAGSPITPARVPETQRGRDLPIEGVITNPDWQQKPSADDLSRYYPGLAAFVAVEGNATISCSVTSQGSLANCSVVSETPKGFRFGEATVKAASIFRMRPMTVDGATVSGGTVRIPLRWRLPRPPAPPAAQGAANSSPKALAAGRRVAAVTTGLLASGWETAAQRWKERLPDMSPEEQTALEAYQQSLRTQIPREAERYAEIYARAYTEQELNDVGNFLESSSGRSWFSRQTELAKLLQPEVMRFYAAVGDAARERICQTIACEQPPAPPQVPAAK